MTRLPDHRAVLRRAHDLAVEYLDGVAARPVRARMSGQALSEHLKEPLPDGSSEPALVVERLSRLAEPGLVASAGPRYFGFVTGGALPSAVGADWLAAAWDQNGSLHVMSPALSTLEDVVSGWVLDLLGLPASASVGFVTGCQMANFTCLAAARHEVLRRVGWDVEARGLQQAPRVSIVVGDEVHVSAVGALRYLGFGASELIRVDVDGQGRMRSAALEDALAAIDGPAIVCAQAGNVATGASDPFDDVVSIAHARGAWVHVDGAFGLWAAAVPSLRDQVRGCAGADSWATDAHKWLNVPYDSGLAIVADPAPHRAAMSQAASYLQRGGDEERSGMDWVPEASRRARVFPLWALLTTLGRQGVVDLVTRNCRLARRMAERLSREPGIRILNEVVLNQVLVHFGLGDAFSDTVTVDTVSRVQEDGTCWAGGATWQGRRVMRISVSNWSTTDADIDASADAIVACYRAARR